MAEISEMQPEHLTYTDEGSGNYITYGLYDPDGITNGHTGDARTFICGVSSLLVFFKEYSEGLVSFTVQSGRKSETLTLDNGSFKNSAGETAEYLILHGISTNVITVTSVFDDGTILEATKELTIVPYSKPLIKTFTVERNSDNKAVVKASGILNVNSQSFMFDYSVREYGDDAFGNVKSLGMYFLEQQKYISMTDGKTAITIENETVDKITFNADTGEFVLYEITNNIFDADKPYGFKLIVSDDIFARSTYLRVLPATSPAVFVDDSGFHFNVPAVFNGNEKILWEGVLYMSDEHTITLSEPITKQANGIILTFSPYTNETARDYCKRDFVIPKYIAKTESGQTRTYLMSQSNFQMVCEKTLRIYDDRIEGAALNVSSGTANGITYNNKVFVLRRVIGF